MEEDQNAAIGANAASGAPVDPVNVTVSAASASSQDIQPLELAGVLTDGSPADHPTAQVSHPLAEPSPDAASDEMFGSISSLDAQIQSIRSRRVASKWLKTSVLRKDPRVARHIPDTRLYTSAELSAMLDAYGKVVLKPVVGSGGSGLIMVTRSEGHYLVRHGRSIRRYSGFPALTAAVRRIARRRKYLIQRAVNLATIHGRPIDYRVKMEKSRKGWSTRAMVGRLARPGLFVTNLRRGGTQLRSADGIRRSISAAAVQPKKNEMLHITRLSISLLERAFPGVNRLGFDYGFDQHGKLWMFEVNTAPR